MKYSLLVLLSFMILGCQNLPSPSETHEADYGEFPQNYVEITNQFLKEELRDPETAEIANHSEPVKKWIGDKITGVEYGYLVCVDVNSKNIFGNMAGVRKDAILIRNNEVVEYQKGGELLSGMKLCG